MHVRREHSFPANISAGVGASRWWNSPRNSAIHTSECIKHLKQFNNCYNIQLYISKRAEQNASPQQAYALHQACVVKIKVVYTNVKWKMFPIQLSGKCKIEEILDGQDCTIDMFLLLLVQMEEPLCVPFSNHYCVICVY
jgi:hypothetical protein